MQIQRFIGKIEDNRLFFLLLLAILFGLALIPRLFFALSARHPGHGDFAYYYSLAENLAEGRGFQIDYIWNYLNPPETISHPSNDYWMPFTSD